MLFYLDGLTHREVAAELGISVNAVKARLHQARASLEPRLLSLREPKELVAMTSNTAWIDAEIGEIRRGADDHPSGAFGKPHVVILRDPTSGKQLPIWIGMFEALALVASTESVDMPRPMTYQFAANLLQATDSQVNEVRVTSLAQGTFYAQVVLRDDHGAAHTVDARPSDALNLALLTGAPIRVDASLFGNEEATRHDEWRAYPSASGDLAAEVRLQCEQLAEWVREQRDDIVSDE
jgi:bifunctional DNase/RNase